MPEQIKTTQEENNTFARIQGLLQTDPFYKRFREQSQYAPARTDSAAVKEEKQTRLLKQYLSGITRMAGIFRKGLEPRIIENISLKALPESYSRAERARREALNQDFNEETEFARLTADKRERVKEWLERLTQPDHYTPAFQYLLWRTLVREHDAKTVNPLPQFHEMPVGMTEELILACDKVSKGRESEAIEKIFVDQPFFRDKEHDTVWKDHVVDLVRRNDVRGLYDELSKLVTSLEETKGDVRGRWVIYSKDGIIDDRGRFLERGDGARMLRDASVHSPWCLGRYATAQSYLARGSVQVFLTYTSKGERPAFGIAVDGDGVAYEARGADDSQELMPQFAAIADERLSHTAGGEQYRERLDDAKKLSLAARFLENPKHADFNTLTPELQEEYRRHVAVIYELDRKLLGFGYGENAYAKKIRQARNSIEDAEVIFGAIAKTPSDITGETKAYIGPLSKELWEKLGAIKHLYTSFPEGRINRMETTIGEMSPAELKTALSAQGINISSYAEEMLTHKEFTVRKASEHIDLMRLTVQAFGFPNGATTDEIYAAAEKLGLELCPAEVGPHLRLTYSGSESMLIAMKQIANRDGYPSVFYLNRHHDGLWLGGSRAKPSDGWDADYRFVFRSRKS